MGHQITMFINDDTQQYTEIKNMVLYDERVANKIPTHLLSSTDNHIKTIREYIDSHKVFTILIRDISENNEDMVPIIERISYMVKNDIIKDRSTIIGNKEKLKGLSINNVDEILKVSSYSEYESSFLTRGFTKPINKTKEGIIHNLPINYLNNIIMEITDNLSETEEIRYHHIDRISQYIVNNIEEHISNIDDINKYDIISDTNYNDIINIGDKIEIKKNDVHKVTDSYYSEPLTSPVKRSNSPILNNDEYLKTYNDLIYTVYSYLKGNNIGDKIISLYRRNVKGIFFEDYVYIPLNNIELYISNRGRSTSHNRLTIRYKIISTDNIYILKDNNLIPYNENIKLENNYIYL
jgi:hypothetical protein